MVSLLLTTRCYLFLLDDAGDDSGAKRFELGRCFTLLLLAFLFFLFLSLFLCPSPRVEQLAGGGKWVGVEGGGGWRWVGRGRGCF